MKSINLAPDVLQIASLLEAVSCSLTINSENGSRFELTAQTDNELDIFDLKLEFDRQQEIAIFTVTTTESIDRDEYIHILDLLNFLNVNDGERKFYLNPVTSTLSCSSGLYIARGRVHSSLLNNRIRTNLSIAMADLSKLMKCCSEKAPLRDALTMTIGDTSEILCSLQ